MREEAMELVREDCVRVLVDSAPSLKALSGECVLITGGTGFFGTWLTELIAFLNDQYHFGIQLLLLSSRAHRFVEKAPHLVARKDITLIDRDIRGVIDVPSEVSWLIHAAGNPDNRLHASDPIGTIDVI